MEKRILRDTTSRAMTKQSPRSATTVSVVRQARQAAPDPRVPDHVWATLQQAGDVAAGRLLDLLNSATWHTLKSQDQSRLIQLAFSYAYGAPAQAPKEKITQTISGETSDAISASLTRLADMTTLPEYGPQTKPVDGS